MYPEEITRPSREELKAMGIQELVSSAEVESALSNTQGTTLLFVNSVCGCAAGSARPGLAMALQHDNKPDRVHSVFAGVDVEATSKARTYLQGVPPSSPSIALFKDGELVYMIERHMIEGRYPDQVAEALKSAFDEYCSN